MDNNVNTLFEQWDQFKDSHLKLYTPERKKFLMDLCDRFRCECKDATVSVEDRQTFLVLHITAEFLLASDDLPTLKELIHQANVFQAEAADQKVTFHLGYQCWDWTEKP